LPGAPGRATGEAATSTEPGKTRITISAKELSAIIEGIRRPEKRWVFAKDNNVKVKSGRLSNAANGLLDISRVAVAGPAPLGSETQKLPRL
jgi:hypothetical protein